MGITEELRSTAAKLMNVGKFAVDSAVTESLRGGLQVSEFVKGKLNGRPPLDHLCTGSKRQDLVVVEQMQANLEKTQQDLNNIRQKSTISTPPNEEQEQHLLQEPLKRKIFIRSRL